MSAEEVVRNSPLRDDFPTTDLCTLIYPNEFLYFDEVCLTLDLYDYLLDIQRDFDGVDEYTDDTYDLGELVYYKGQVYASLTDANTSLPTVAVDWQLYKKFDEVDYPQWNLLWDYHLKYALGLHIAMAGVRYATNPASAHGIVSLEETDRTHVKNVSESSLQAYKRELQVDRDKRTKAMLKWMERTKETYVWTHTPFDTSATSDSSECGTGDCDRRLQGKVRVGWRN